LSEILHGTNLKKRLLMLTLKDEILINQFGQGIATNEVILDQFLPMDIGEKRIYLKGIIDLILQSKPSDDNIESAIHESKLKTTFTPCVILRKGVRTFNLQKMADLPDNEMEKVLNLLLTLFKVAYFRRFKEEKNTAAKWWYWDLSDSQNVKRVFELFHD